MHARKDLSIVYMGTPEFALEPLRAILEEGYTISAVVTAPDKPAGRGQKISQSAVKIFAIENGLTVLQPERLKDQYFINQIIDIKPDIIVVVAFRMLPEAVWKIPRLGTFNLHASLLPQYRGAAPINWAIINGEKSTGLTTFLIDQQIDTGSILCQEEVTIDADETAGELHDKLMKIGGRLVVQTIDNILTGKVLPKAQQNLMGTNAILRAAPKLYKETCGIDWGKPAEQIHNHIRGLSPFPAAWTNLAGMDDSINTKIFRSSMVNNSQLNNDQGKISTDGKTFIHVHCGRGIISVEEIQIAGKRNLSVKDFLLGFRGIDGYTFR
jgi:methionyl-tRNA formyltransferase